MTKMLHEQLKTAVKLARNLEELEKIVYKILNSVSKKEKIVFVAGPISARTKLGKKYNRYKLDVLTKKVAKLVAPENAVALSCAITPPHLEKFSINNFYNMYDRISDRGEKLYLTGNWKKSKGAIGEYERAKKRGIEIFEVKEVSPITFFGFSLWVPVEFRKIVFEQLQS